MRRCGQLDLAQIQHLLLYNGLGDMLLPLSYGACQVCRQARVTATRTASTP